MDNVSLLPSFLRMIFALAIVLGLLIGVMYFLKKFLQPAGSLADDSSLIKIIATRHLGAKNSIVLIEVLDQVIVVGISNQQMTPLACIDDPQALANIKIAGSSSRTFNFSDGKLAKYISRLNIYPNKKREADRK